MNSYLSKVGKHPGACVTILAVLVVLVIVLTVLVFHYKGACGAKSNFGVSPVNNLTTGSNNPLWQLGSMDAGNWGPIHRDPTAYNVAEFHPSWRAGPQDKEGMAARRGMPAAHPGAQYRPMAPGPHAGCATGWDPAASAEVEALATAGASNFEHVTHGSQSLMSAIEGATDGGPSKLSDENLTDLMHHGGMP